MKRLLATATIVLMALGVAIAQEAAKAGGAKAAGPAAQALMDLENQWVKASMTSNAEALAPLLSEDFVALDSDGTMHGKADVLARTKKAKWTTNAIADVKVVDHGSSAIVTGSWTGKGVDGAGKAVDAKERWADTWVKTAGGKWQCVASASAPSK